MKNYNIGLDIGTNSVGWAVVEANTQKIIRKGKGKNRKALWGVRLFNSAVPARDRRLHRSSRRRYERRRQRIKLLQEEFQEEINNVDKDFFQKLKESKYFKDDNNNRTIKLSKIDEDFQKSYHKKYKTIYHLRNRLINDKSKEDIRLVYLAIHHIIKYRGNFLYNFEGFSVEKLNIEEKLDEVFNSLISYCPNLDIPNEYKDIIDLKKINKTLMSQSKNDIKINLAKLLKEINQKFVSEFTKLIIGNSFSLKKLFMLDTDEDLKISLQGSDYDEKYAEIESLLGNQIEVLDVLKQLYDMIFLKKIFNGKNISTISKLMIEKYSNHNEDLNLLKNILREDRKIYNKFFRSKKAINDKKDYCIYDKYLHNLITFEDLKNEFIKCDVMSKIKDLDLQKDFQKKLDSEEFLPRITSTENGKYPYQLNKSELIKIIENQGVYYPFLKEKVNGTYKIVKLLEFKIPYYVGPLTSEKNSKNAWMERKIEKVKITPYNFDDVVSKELTAEKFIKRMISHCTYLLNEFALPNNSILYSKFKVMNELKQIRVNGNRLENDMQHKIIEELFLKTNGSITDKKFKIYLKKCPDFKMYTDDISITGYSADKKFANDMQSYIDFFGENGIFKDTSYTEKDAEKIIEWVVIFKDKDILENKIRKEFKELNNSKINRILTKRYNGWGRLSKRLLETPYYIDKETNIKKSIIDLMYESKENFMQILNNNKYKFQKMIKEFNNYNNPKIISYKLVEDLATSPATKRGIYQALKIVDEIIKYMGHNPKNIVIEMAREEEEKKRKDDRKKYLLNLYKKQKESIHNSDNLLKQLNKMEKIDTTKLFLYFIQEGKCLYSQESIDIENLEECEIDHILPRTIISDNSIDNKALVLRKCNQEKGSSLILPRNYRSDSNKKWWFHLKKVGLISPKKFYNLTREKFSDEDIQGFINRQLVETRQVTKHVANILEKLYEDTKVVYLKASVSHNYREKFELFKFREINDFHHAHDAYLAAVLGEYKENYYKQDISVDIFKAFIDKLLKEKNYKELKYGFVINSLDSNHSALTTDSKTGEVIFDSEKFNKVVEDTLYRNDILVTRKTEIRKGILFKETIKPAGKANVELKKGMPTNKYGGYTSIYPSYLTIVAYLNKTKIIGIPKHIAIQSKRNNLVKMEYVKNHLKLSNDFKIIKDYIPFESLINYNNHDVYIKGYSVANKVCELSNANQLKIPKIKMQEWKYIFNKILNNKKIDENIWNNEKQIFIMREIIYYLYDSAEKYPLFKNAVDKIKTKIDINMLDNKDLQELIKSILLLYKCNSKNPNMEIFKLGDRVGRLNGVNVDKAIFKYHSITGIKESTYEF